MKYMNQIGWEYEFSGLFSEENKKYLRGELSQLNVLNQKSFVTFFKKFLELSVFKCITVWFRPPPQKIPASDKLKFFSHTYTLHVNRKGEITLDKDDGGRENLVKIKKSTFEYQCGEGLSAIRSILYKML